MCNYGINREDTVKILVTVKRVTDPDAKIKVRADGTGIETEGIEYKVNPFDENGVEEAVSLKEANGGEVVALSIGTEDAIANMRTALAIGANRGILVLAEDEKLDSDLTAQLVTKVAQKEQPDLIIVGKQAVDGDSGQVGQVVAEYMGLPQACFASNVDVQGDKLVVQREVDGGIETIEMDLPAVITADLRLNVPRLPKLPNILKAKRKKIEQLTPEDLGVAMDLKVETLKFEAPPERKSGEFVKTVEELLEKLHNEAKVI